MHFVQAFIKTAAKILQNIQDGVFDVSNEVINIFSLMWGFFKLFGTIRLIIIDAIEIWHQHYKPTVWIKVVNINHSGNYSERMLVIES